MKVGRLTRHVQDAGMVMDSMGGCVFYNMIGLPLQLENLARILHPQPRARKRVQPI